MIFTDDILYIGEVLLYLITIGLGMDVISKFIFLSDIKLDLGREYNVYPCRKISIGRWILAAFVMALSLTGLYYAYYFDEFKVYLIVMALFAVDLPLSAKIPASKLSFFFSDTGIYIYRMNFNPFRKNYVGYLWDDLEELRIEKLSEELFSLKLINKNMRESPSHIVEGKALNDYVRIAHEHNLKISGPASTNAGPSIV
ncbi:MAG: hypothetical protein ACLFR2_04475 [Candidatus Kapaibacterium sp.]